MKKQLAAVAAATFALTGALALTGTAMAASAHTGDVEVKYEAQPDYDLAIPSAVNLDAKQATSARVGVWSANLGPGQTLNITVSSDGYETEGSNALTLKNKADSSVKAVTSVTDAEGKPLAKGGVAATFTGVIDNTPSSTTKTVNFSVIKDAAGRKKVQAGKYTTVMTFTGSIIDAQ